MLSCHLLLLVLRSSDRVGSETQDAIICLGRRIDRGNIAGAGDKGTEWKELIAKLPPYDIAIPCRSIPCRFFISLNSNVSTHEWRSGEEYIPQRQNVLHNWRRTEHNSWNFL